METVLDRKATEFRKKLAELPREELLELIELQDPELLKQVNRIEWVFKNKLKHLKGSDGLPITNRNLTNEELAYLIDVPFTPDQELSKMGLTIQRQKEIHIANDAVLWAKEVLGFKLRAYQILMIRNPSLRKVLRAGRRLGKALDVDTPIPTPDGWKTMGELEVGDQVFDENGKPCNVTFVTDYQYDRQCYEVIFSDGSSIVADADHQWTVDTKASRKARARSNNPQKLSVTLTTKDMLDSLYIESGNKLEANYSIEVAAPVQYPKKDLSIDPWLLGMWLGDGTSASGAITVGKDDQDFVLSKISSLGYEITRKDNITFNILGLFSTLRKLKLLKNYRATHLSYEKHIPSEYLTASVEQREELLKGLMDSDGTVVNNGSGNCEFSVTSERLAKDTLELIHSLGYRATYKVSDAKLYGRMTSKRYRINFTPWKAVFSLPRKLDRQNIRKQPSSRQRCRYIVSIKEVESRPVKCITVDSVNSLYLAGESFIPTHNTATMAMILLHYAFTTNNGRCLVVTPTKEQGGLIWQEINKYIKMSEDVVMKAVSRNVTSPNYRLEFTNGATISFFSSGEKSGGKADVTRGQEAHIIILDEMDYISSESLIALYAMLQKTDENQQDKVLIAASTPTGRQDVFWEWCFPAGTPVSTPSGIARIEDVKLGDKVINAYGKEEEVTNVFVNPAKELTTIKTWYGLPISSTPNHPHLVLRDNTEDFMPAKDILPGDYLMISDRPIRDSAVDLSWYLSGTKRRIQTVNKAYEIYDKILDMDNLFAMGLYLAEGHLIKDGTCIKGVTWTFEKNEVDLLSETKYFLSSLGIKYKELNRSSVDNTRQIIVWNSALGVLFKHLFDEKEHKRIPAFVDSVEKSRQDTFIDGLLSGDGFLHSGVYGISLTATNAIWDLFYIRLKMGYLSSLYLTEKANRRPVLTLRLSKGDRDYVLKKDGNFFVKVRDTCTDSVDTTVYNFETAETHTYVAGGYATHNCTKRDEGFTEFWFPSYCFTQGHKVAMADGSYVNIEDIKPGDLVRTERGSRKVVRTFERNYDGDLLNITTFSNNQAIRVTPEHPFCASERNRKQNDSYEGRRSELNWKWIEAKDLTQVETRNQNSGHWLRLVHDPYFGHSSIDLSELLGLPVVDGRVKVSPRSKNSLPATIIKDESLATLAGWYLAEGNIDKTVVEWTLNKNETNVVDDLNRALKHLDAGEVSVKENLRHNTITARVRNGALATLLAHLCGRGSCSKQLSIDIIRAPKDFQAQFINVYAQGDGWESKPGCFDMRTSSEVLAYQLRDICMRLDWICSITRSEGGLRDFGNGYGPYKTADSYLVSFNPNSRSTLGKKPVPGGAAVLIKDITHEPYSGKVYNFEVEDTNSYTVNGILVHNCNPYFNKEQEDEFRKRYTENGYRHEIEADWGDSSDGVYPRRFLDKAFQEDWEYRIRRDYEDCFYLIGVDWDKYGAGTNIAVLRMAGDKFPDPKFRNKLALVYREEVNQDEYTLTNAVNRIIELNAIYNPRHIYVDRGAGETQVEMLHKQGKDQPLTGLQTKVVGVAFRESIEVRDPYTKIPVKKEAKPFMVDNMRLLFENEQIIFPQSDYELFKQFLAYAVLRTSIYGSPVFDSGGTADHAHDAIMLAALAYTQHHSNYLRIDYDVSPKAVSNETFNPLFTTSDSSEIRVSEERIVEEKWGGVANAPVQVRRNLTYSVRKGSKPFRRRMF